MPHPHTQILATPTVATAVQNRYTRARGYLETQRQCLFCALLQAEIAAGTRIVLAHTSYVAYQPYAAFFPYETWIVPRDHQACFGNASDIALTHLACILHDVVRRLAQVLQDPDYNLVVRTALTEAHEPAYHWHLQLLPRLFSLAGFELGSGMAINPVRPETAAAALRNVERSA
jgi:UDPglucose--hexose-1-phosphate uridylyltransferase